MKKEIFLVPYAHLDTQWRWEYPTTIGKYIKRTLTENLKHFDRFSDYQFTFTGAIRYQMMKDYYPEDFARLKEYVRQGRWHLAGTCMDETDALIPCVESMVRNVLYGDRWQAKEFGRSSRDYMIPDCFGFPGNMPTVLLHCGIRGFSTQKLTWHSAAGIPFGIGIWKGKDGSELPSALDPCAYVSKVKSPFFLNRQRLKRLKAQIKTTGIGKSFQYFGVGDIGGAPGTGSVKAARAAAAKSPLKGDITIRQGSPDQFFRTLTPQEKEKLQRYEGDLLLTLHSAGTLTSAAVMKRWNRKNEQLAFAAEAAACAAWFQAGQAYPADKIRKAWRLVLGSQMHDILPGTSTPDAYTYAHNDEVLALNLWSSILEDAAAALAPLAGGEGDILLYNPCELSRKDPVRVDLSGREAYRGLKGECLLTDPEGREYGGQVVTDEKGRQILCFIPALEPFSWTRFSLHRDRTTVSSPVSLRKRESGYLLENECYRVLVTLEGAVSSIYHKDLDREILSRPPAYELQKEVPGIFPAWNMDWKDRQKPPFVRMEAGGTVSVAEEGPRRCTLRIETPCASSRFLREISLSAGSEIVEFCETIDWNETGCSLKLAFTGAMETGRFTTNWESSREVRDVNHEKIYEMPSRYWADLSSGEDWGFSILEDSKYGYDHPAADTLRMTLLYTPGLKRSDPFRDQSSQDRGRHTIRYALYGHPGDWRQGSDVQARRFNQPVRPFLLSPGSARQPGRHTPLFRLDTEAIGVLGVKKAEDSDDLVIRLYERQGEEAEGVLSFSDPLAGCDRINGLEEILEDLTGSISSGGESVKIRIPANGLLSLRIRYRQGMVSSSAAAEPESLENHLELPLNETIFTPAGGTGVIPEDLRPEQIQGSGVLYQLRREGEGDCLRCDGQILSLPEGPGTRLSLLCAAEKDCTLPVVWLDREGRECGREEVSFQALTGRIGSWDTRIWKKTPRHADKMKRDYLWLNSCTGIEQGFVKRDRVEWFARRTLKDGRIQPYRYACLFSKNLMIPETAVSVKLPESGQVLLFAASTGGQQMRAEALTCLTDAYDF